MNNALSTASISNLAESSSLPPSTSATDDSKHLKRQRIDSLEFQPCEPPKAQRLGQSPSLKEICTFGAEVEFWGKAVRVNDKYHEDQCNYEIVDLANPLVEEKVGDLISTTLCAGEDFDVTLDTLPSNLLEFRTLPGKTGAHSHRHAFNKITQAISLIQSQINTSGGRPISLKNIIDHYNRFQTQPNDHLKTDLIEPLNDRLSEVGFLARLPIHIDDLRLKPQMTFTLPLEAVDRLFRMPPEQSIRFLDSRCAPPLTPAPTKYATIPQGLIENRAAELGEALVREIEQTHSCTVEERGQLRGLMQLISYIGIHSVLLSVNASLIDTRFNRVDADSKDQFRFLPRSNLFDLMQSNLSNATKQLLIRNPIIANRIYQSCFRVAAELGGAPFKDALNNPFCDLKPAEDLIHSALTASDAFEHHYFEDFLGGLCTQVDQKISITLLTA